MHNRRGFTLIELVVVIAILGILAGIAIPRFLDAQASARGAKLVGDLRTIDSAINLYAAKYGEYPTTLEQITTADANKVPPNEVLIAEGIKPPTATSKMLITQRDGKEKEFTTSGTEYTIVNGRGAYTCSTDKDQNLDFYLGNTGAISSGEVETPSESPVETPTTPGTGGNGNMLSEINTNSWQDFVASAASNYGANTGTAIYTDGTDYYLLKNNQYLTKADAAAGITLAEFAAKNPGTSAVLNTGKPLNSSSYSETNEGTKWNEGSVPQMGDVYQDGNTYYVAVQNLGESWGFDLNDTGNWLKLN